MVFIKKYSSQYINNVITGHSGILLWILFALAPHIRFRISLRFLSLEIILIENILSLSTLYSLPSDGLQVFAVTVHSVKIHPRSVDKAASHLYLVVLEAVHHWSVAIAVLDVPVVVHSPVSTE